MGRISEPPYPSHFNYPSDASQREMRGQVIKATKLEISESSSGDYATRIELIEVPEEPEPFIRFAYYRRPVGKKGDNDWTFAGQYTWVFPIRRTLRAIKEAEKMGLFAPDHLC